MKEIDFNVDGVDMYKRTALTLYALNETDQKWMLSNLPERHRAKLNLLLSELRDLGMEANKNEIDVLLHSPEFVKEQAIEYDNKQHEHTIDAANIRDIETLLNDEPACMVAMLLSINHWSWSSDYLDGLSQNFKDEIRPLIDEHMGIMTVTKKDYLMEYVSSRLN